MGLSFGMRQRQRESHSLYGDEVGAGPSFADACRSPILRGSVPGIHSLGFLEEQSNGLFEVPEGLFFTAAARGDVQLQGVSYIAATFFENASSELNLHSL
jgi:hypothetical protein